MSTPTTAAAATPLHLRTPHHHHHHAHHLPNSYSRSYNQQYAAAPGPASYRPPATAAIISPLSAYASALQQPASNHGAYAISQPPSSAKKRKRDEAAYADARPRVPLAHAPNTAAAAAAAAEVVYYDGDPNAARRKRARRPADVKREVDGGESLPMPYKAPQPPIQKSGDVTVRVVREPRVNRGTKIDDDDGHYIVTPESDLTENYKIVKVLGQGTFGKVVQARDKRHNKMVAIKIIRSVQKYRDASRIELRVLQTLRLNDEENRNRCIHLRDCFDFRGHICIVMDLLGQSVFDFLRSTQFVPFPNSHIQSFARQLLTSVAYLHDVNLIHTDLKPENILLCEDAYQTFTYSKKIPSSSSTVSRTANQRRVLLNPEIRLIDFGSATFQDEYHSSVVSTRHYRAPEIILGLGWSFPCDIWSIGCILVEFFTGDALFQTHDNLEHLAMMEAVVGARIDPHIVDAVNRLTPRAGQPTAASFFKRSVLDYPTRDTGRVSKRFVKAMKPLEQIIPCSTSFYKLFLDLLRKIFVYDPDKRISAHDALNHPWFREPPIADDGTEAAKIRQQRLNMATNSLID
jgi:dual-specificity kinase